MLITGIGILSNVKIIILKKENFISFSHWTDEKSGNPEKAGRMASLQMGNYCEDFWGKKQRPLVVLRHHKENVQCVAFSPEGLLGVGSKDIHVSVWSI